MESSMFRKILDALGQKETYEDTARGAVQGGTMGWGDEITALMRADKDRLDRKQYDSTDGMKEDYSKYLDEERNANADAQERSPIGYGIGDIGGGIPVVGPLGLGGAALMGGTSSLGHSEADTPEDMLADTAKGAGTGMVFSGLMSSLGRYARGKKPPGGPPLPNNVTKLPTAAKEEVVNDFSAQLADKDAPNVLDFKAPTVDRSAEIEGYLSNRKDTHSKMDSLYQRIKDAWGEKPTTPNKPELDSFDKFLSRFQGADEKKVREAMEIKGSTQAYTGSDISNPIFHPKNPDFMGYPQVPVREPDITGGIMGKELLSGGPDPFAWVDAKYGLSKKLLEENQGKPLTIITRSDLISHDDYMDKLVPGKNNVVMLIAGDNDNFSKNLVPGAPSFGRQLKAAKKLRDAGINVEMHVERIDGMRPDWNSLSLEAQAELAKAGIKWHERLIKPNKNTIKNIEKVLGPNWRGDK